MGDREMVTQLEAAMRLGVSKALVRKWVKDGRLSVAAVYGQMRLLWADEVEAMRGKKGTAGRPRKAAPPEDAPPPPAAKKRGRPRKPKED